MKKIILIASLTASLTGLSVFGQGYFMFTTGKSQVWDCFTGSPQLATTVNVAFLWAANGSVPQVSYLYPGPTPTSGLPPSFLNSVAWNDILTDPNYTLAANSGNGQVAVAQSSASGILNYGFFNVSGTMVGTTYSLFMVGWDANYATPVLASAANAAVGWSAPFNYTAFASTASPASMTGLTPAFGVWGVPEPSTLALAGLGSLSLWLLRRRK
jgi:hypothetical protein